MGDRARQIVAEWFVKCADVVIDARVADDPTERADATRQNRWVRLPPPPSRPPPSVRRAARAARSRPPRRRDARARPRALEPNPHPTPTTPPPPQFNLDVDSREAYAPSLRPWKRAASPPGPMVLDVHVEWPASDDDDVDDDPARGETTPTPRRRRRALAERWTFTHEPRDDGALDDPSPDPSPSGDPAASSGSSRFGSRRRRGDFDEAPSAPVAYKHAVIMLRALHATARTLPASAYKERGGRSRGGAITDEGVACATVAVVPADSGGSTPGSKISDADANGFETRRFAPVATPDGGRLLASVAYAPEDALEAAGAPPPPPPPEVEVRAPDVPPFEGTAAAAGGGSASSAGGSASSSFSKSFFGRAVEGATRAAARAAAGGGGGPDALETPPPPTRPGIFRRAGSRGLLSEEMAEHDRRRFSDDATKDANANANADANAGGGSASSPGGAPGGVGGFSAASPHSAHAHSRPPLSPAPSSSPRSLRDRVFAGTFGASSSSPSPGASRFFAGSGSGPGGSSRGGPRAGSNGSHGDRPLAAASPPAAASPLPAPIFGFGLGKGDGKAKGDGKDEAVLQASAAGPLALAGPGSPAPLALPLAFAGPASRLSPVAAVAEGVERELLRVPASSGPESSAAAAAFSSSPSLPFAIFADRGGSSSPERTLSRETLGRPGGAGFSPSGSSPGSFAAGVPTPMLPGPNTPGGSSIPVPSSSASPDAGGWHFAGLLARNNSHGSHGVNYFSGSPSPSSGGSGGWGGSGGGHLQRDPGGYRIPGSVARSPGSFRRASWSSPRSSPGASLRDSGSVSGGGMTLAEAARLARARAGIPGDDDDAAGDEGDGARGDHPGTDRSDAVAAASAFARSPAGGPFARGGAHSLGTSPGTRFPRFVGTPSVSPSSRRAGFGTASFASPSRLSPGRHRGSPDRKADRSDRDRSTHRDAGEEGAAEDLARYDDRARYDGGVESRDSFARNDGRSSEASGGASGSGGSGAETGGSRASSGLERRRGGSEDQGPDDGEALPFALDFPEDEEEEDPDRTRIDRGSTAAEEGNDDDQEARATTTGTTGTRSTLPHTTPDPKPNPTALISAEALVRMLRDAPPLTEGAVGEPGGGGAEEAEAPPRDLAWVRARLEEHAAWSRAGAAAEARRAAEAGEGREDASAAATAAATATGGAGARTGG